MLPGWDVEQVDDAEFKYASAPVESLSLLHAVAESVVRLYEAMINCPPDGSPWFSMAEDKNSQRLRTISSHLAETVASDPSLIAQVRESIFPRWDLLSKTVGMAELDKFVAWAVAWLKYFGTLVSPDGSSSNVAHNQIKHGLAVVPTDQLRIDLVLSIQNPSAPTVAELNAGVPIVNIDALQYLHRFRPDKGHDWGWRLDIRNSDPALNLALAYVGIMLLEQTWLAGRFKFAPFLIDAGQTMSFIADPLPEDVLRHRSTDVISVARNLIPPRKVSSV